LAKPIPPRSLIEQPENLNNTPFGIYEMWGHIRQQMLEIFPLPGHAIWAPPKFCEH